MGRLLCVYPCPVCGYHVEGELHEGGSGVDVSLLRNHYVLATCADCHHLVSVLLPNTAQETQEALDTARRGLVQMEADAIIGDDRAKFLIPFFRASLDEFSDSVPAAISECTMCGSQHVEIITMAVKRFDAQTAWIQCPRCEEGRLLIETCGSWD